MEPEISAWLEHVRKAGKRILYVTFGSMMKLSQSFIDFLYFGLKKSGLAVMWSLREGTIPEENEFFFVRAWLPQSDLFQL